MQLNPLECLKQGLYVENAINPTRLTTFLRRLHPVHTTLDLIRIGGEGDGGYLIPNDLENIAACFSPGVADTSNFEQDLYARFGIESHLADYSVLRPPLQFRPKSFVRKFIGCSDNEIFTTMDRWVSECEPGATDLLLQMDIEGGEYTSLLNCSSNLLNRFRIIALEVHHVYAWGHQRYFDIIEALFERLLQFFHVVHIHPNNNDGLISIHGIDCPRTFEITLIRRDRAERKGFTQLFPHPLDRPNSPGIDEMRLPLAWFNQSPGIETKKWVLCRPQGGMNDILCAIEKCRVYCEKYGRKLVIDARRSGLMHDFYHYFDTEGDPVFAAEHERPDIDSTDVIPAFLTGRVNDYSVEYSFGEHGFVDTSSKGLLTFDFERDYNASLLVHEQGWEGGELQSIYLLSRLRLTRAARSRILDNLQDLPPNFTAVHVRHTDYLTDYKTLIESIKESLRGKTVIVCSDSSEVLEYVRVALSESTVIRLSRFFNASGERLHYRNFGDSQFDHNIEMLTDLFALSMAQELIFGNVIEAGRPSGFSLLAKALSMNKHVINQLLGLSVSPFK